MSKEIEQVIKSYINFPKKGIVFRDVLPLLQNPEIFSNIIAEMSSSKILQDADAILSIDARGFIFGSAISLYLSKPMIVARKPGKLPGKVIEKSYNLEYGNNSLAIQVDSLEKFNSFAIVDDLLATGGTVKCVSEILKNLGKEVCGLSVVIELQELNGRDNFEFPVDSNIILWRSKSIY